MRILVISQYFWPESFVINDLVCELSRSGHSVTVATGKPNYPQGTIAPGYRQSGITCELFADSVELIRIPLRPRGKARALDLSLNYLSFVASSLIRLPWLLRKREFDVIFFFGVSPLTAAIPAVLLSWLKKTHLVLWIQDLWPESLSATGFVKNRSLLFVVGLMVRSIYRSADTLLLQSKAFFDPVSVYADRKKLVYFPNPAPEISGGGIHLPPVIMDHFADCFSVVFAGNLGRAQALQTIVEAAQLLGDYPDIRFVIIGTGSEAATLARSISESGLTNIRMTGFIDREMMPSIFKAASVLMVTLAKDSALELVIPSKLQAYMQAGRPIVGALDGEGARVITEAGVGLVVGAEDAEGLANAVRTLYLMPSDKRELFGRAGQKFFELNYKLQNSTKRLIEIFHERIGIRP